VTSQTLKPFFVKTFLAVAIAAGLFPARAAITNDSALWRPRFATPALVALDTAANRQFTVEVKAAPEAAGWSVTLSNDLKAWSCPVVSATWSTINLETEPGWRIKALVPPDISPELFTLVVACDKCVSAQRQAVSVVPAFASDFYILHITDEQIVNQIHTDPSGQYWHMVGTWEEMKWMQEPVNLINPRFAIITGDQIDFNGALDAWNNWSNWGYTPKGKKTFTERETTDIENRLSVLYQDCHRGYRVPYVSAPGNHDVTPANKLLAGSSIRWHPISISMYESYFGQRSWSFRMGDFYVLMHDWSESSLKTWAEHDYSASLEDPTVTFRLIGQHFITDQAMVPAACDLMLIGHGHATATMKSSPYYIYQDGPAFKYGTTGFFNFRRNAKGWSCDQTTSPRDTAKDVWPLFTDNGLLKKVRANRPDAMHVTADSLSITNDLPRNFYDGRVRFVLSKGTYSHVTNGAILAQYDCFNGTKTAVLVKVNIPANDTITVTVPGAQHRLAGF
jgi:hypothetical protein